MPFHAARRWASTASHPGGVAKWHCSALAFEPLDHGHAVVIERAYTRRLFGMRQHRARAARGIAQKMAEQHLLFQWTIHGNLRCRALRRARHSGLQTGEKSRALALDREVNGWLATCPGPAGDVPDKRADMAGARSGWDEVTPRSRDMRIRGG